MENQKFVLEKLGQKEPEPTGLEFVFSFV